MLSSKFRTFVMLNLDDAKLNVFTIIFKRICDYFERH